MFKTYAIEAVDSSSKVGFDLDLILFMCGLFLWPEGLIDLNQGTEKAPRAQQRLTDNQGVQKGTS